MKLSDYIGKKIYAGNAYRGVCVGGRFSLKTYELKYLVVARNGGGRVEFTVALKNARLQDGAVYFSSARAVDPKNTVRFYPNRPVFDERGGYLGETFDLELDGVTVVRLILKNGEAIPASRVSAFLDAVLVKPAPVFPLGEFLSENVANEAQGTLVTRGVLRRAIERDSLITLTRSLLRVAVQKNEAVLKAGKNFVNGG